ncbi:10728_t:CDS:1, partial [Funneliformis geosporum]
QINLKEQEIQLKNKKIKEMEEWSKGQHNRIVELEAQLIKDKEQIKAEANKQVQAQLADQITQIKKTTGLDTVMNKFISFETLLEKVKQKLEKGSKGEEYEEKIKELEKEKSNNSKTIENLQTSLKKYTYWKNEMKLLGIEEEAERLGRVPN